jgi:hypothetical protein
VKRGGSERENPDLICVMGENRTERGLSAVRLAKKKKQFFNQRGGKKGIKQTELKCAKSTRNKEMMNAKNVLPLLSAIHQKHEKLCW